MTKLKYLVICSDIEKARLKQKSEFRDLANNNFLSKRYSWLFLGNYELETGFFKLHFKLITVYALNHRTIFLLFL